MWPLKRQTTVTRSATISEFDLPLVTGLMANTTGITFGGDTVATHHGLGAIVSVLIGDTRERLEWLEQATVTLGGEINYMPIRLADPAYAQRRADAGMADGLAAIAHAADQAHAAEAIRTGTHTTGRPDVDQQLRRIVNESQALRRKGLDRDLTLARLYIAGEPINPTLIQERSADRQRSAELRDEYVLMNGGEPSIWPF